MVRQFYRALEISFDLVDLNLHAGVVRPSTHLMNPCRPDAINVGVRHEQNYLAFSR